MIGEWHLSELADQFGGTITGDVVINAVSTDTRTITQGALFVALKGERFNAEDFVAQAVEKGAVAAVVSRQLPIDIPQWIVDDATVALGQIGLFNRQRSNAFAYAVTGSAGKTTVKEMLAHVLAQSCNVLATKGNFNNDIGVPLTLLRIETEHTHIVTELGASAVGEIDYTTHLAKPDIAILNNALGAHLEGFGSLQGVVKAKGEIFNGLPEDGWGVVNLDDPHANVWLNANRHRHMITFSVSNSQADVYAESVNTNSQGCAEFEIRYRGDREKVVLQVLGVHNVANALAVSAALLAGGFDLAFIAAGLRSFTAVAGRMCPLTGINGVNLVDDSYNASPGAVKAAIDYLAQRQGQRFLVLGDMAELGDEAEAEHASVGAYAADKGIDYVWAVGALSRHTVTAFNDAHGAGQGCLYDNKQTLIQTLKDHAGVDVTVLVKGSRSARMEDVIAGLREGN